jgi:hypothetical protein
MPAGNNSNLMKMSLDCDCQKALRVYQRVMDWKNQSSEGLRLRCGELTAQEIRTIRAVLQSILSEMNE